MNEILLIVQIIVAILLMVVVLLQQRGSGLGAGFGGGGGDFYSTRRGIEKKLYWGTIILGFSFIVLALINLYIFK